MAACTAYAALSGARRAGWLAALAQRLGVRRGDCMAIADAAAASRRPWRTSGGLPAGGGGDAAVACCSGPEALAYRLHAQRGGGGHCRRIGHRPACCRRATRLPGTAAHPGGGREAARPGRRRCRLGHALLDSAAEKPSAASCLRTPLADDRRRADLHQRHHRPAQGRAGPAPGADWQPQRVRLQPELVSGRPRAHGPSP